MNASTATVLCSCPQTRIGERELARQKRQRKIIAGILVLLTVFIVAWLLRNREESLAA